MVDGWGSDTDFEEPSSRDAAAAELEVLGDDLSGGCDAETADTPATAVVVKPSERSHLFDHPDSFEQVLFPPRSPAGLQSLRWKPVDLLIGVVLMLLWRFGVSLVAEPTTPFEQVMALLLGVGFPLIFVSGFPVLAYYRATGSFRLPLPKVSWIAIELALAGVVALGLLISNAVLANLWQQWFGEGPGMAENMQDVVASRNYAILIVFGGMACFWAPVFEEMFFRGFLQNALGRWMPVAVAALLQGFLFALVHQYGGFHFVMISVMAAVLTLHYLWRKSLIASMFVHFFQNFVATLGLLVVMSMTQSAPVLGVMMEPGSEPCRVREVIPGGPADEAGLRQGDIITHIDSTKISDARTLQTTMLFHQPGDEVTVKFERDGEAMEVKAKLIGREESAGLKE